MPELSVELRRTRAAHSWKRRCLSRFAPPKLLEVVTSRGELVTEVWYGRCVRSGREPWADIVNDEETSPDGRLDRSLDLKGWDVVFPFLSKTVAQAACSKWVHLHCQRLRAEKKLLGRFVRVLVATGRMTRSWTWPTTLLKGNERTWIPLVWSC